jgi:hypothetical protein
MNIFNRVVMVILFLLALATSLLFTIVPYRLIRTAISALDVLERMVARGRPWAIFIGLGFILLWILFLILELWRPPARTVRVLKVTGGQAELATDAIAQRVIYRVDELADVVSVQPKIKAGRGGVDIYLDLVTSPDIDVPAKTEEVMAVVKEVIEERMGLALRKIQVKIRHAPREAT